MKKFHFHSIYFVDLQVGEHWKALVSREFCIDCSALSCGLLDGHIVPTQTSSKFLWIHKKTQNIKVICKLDQQQVRHSKEKRPWDSLKWKCLLFRCFSPLETVCVNSTVFEGKYIEKTTADPVFYENIEAWRDKEGPNMRTGGWNTFFCCDALDL